MKLKGGVALGSLLAIIIALAAASQLYQSDSDIPFTFSKTEQSSINEKISLEEKQDCEMNFYNETEDVYGYVPRERVVYGNCFNPDNESYYKCENGTIGYQSFEIIGTAPVLRNSTKCEKKSYVVSVNKNGVNERKEIDFSGWGACINATENGCAIVTCVSKYDGALNGKFTDCEGGKSCQKFIICQDRIKALYKNSRQDFVEYDPTFYVSELKMKEAGE